jgi:hypothetical protein
VFASGIWDGFQHLDQGVQVSLSEQVLLVLFR